MVNGWIIGGVALLYLFGLFGVAYWRDRTTGVKVAPRPTLYAFSLAVFCTSWTFYGSVGLAARSGYDFLPVYLGPIIAIVFGWPLIVRIIRISKAQNVSSIADFIAARYGKNQYLAALVTIIAVAGTVPYIALQLKAVSISVTTLLVSGNGAGGAVAAAPTIVDISLLVAVFMAAFAVLFGTRHVDATEHQEGLMLAVAVESIVKLLAFLVVGLFIVIGFYGGFDGVVAQWNARPEHLEVFTSDIDGGRWLTIGFLSLISFVLLPRQFHVMVVENRSTEEIKRAIWLFPVYLIAINIFVIPIAMAGLTQFPQGAADADFFVLTLPQALGQSTFTLIAFVGGLSAATAMVMVACVALAIMVCNDLVVPLLIHMGSRKDAFGRSDGDMSARLLKIRRFSILGILVLAYGFLKLFAGYQQLASIGLLSFAAIVQFAPAFFGGLFWRRGTAIGAIGGISAGFLMWGYSLLLPWFVDAGIFQQSLLTDGPFGIGFLNPQALFYLKFDPLTHGVIWSVGTNLAVFVGLSLWRVPEPIERLQANIFLEDDFVDEPSSVRRQWGTQITFDHLKQTVARYLGQERAERSFEQYAKSRNVELLGYQEADIHALRFTEHLLASAIGSASSRLVVSLLLRERNISHQAALRLLDDASEALQYNRDFLQSALDQVGQGLCVFDKNMKLVCWNSQFRALLKLPEHLGRIGVQVDEILRFCALRGDFGSDDIEAIVNGRVKRFSGEISIFRENFGGGKKILEFRTGTMPQGGVAAVIVDVTKRVTAERALVEMNATLEKRVEDRTLELRDVNTALQAARVKADEANKYKTSFLAAASHDLRQPLSAARIYTGCLLDGMAGGGDVDASLVPKIEKSLQSVEDILEALVELSRYETGKMVPELKAFFLQDLFDQITLEFEPIAAQKGLRLTVMPCSEIVRSDERLLRRILQNLISNAIKYTDQGAVLIGARRGHENLQIEVWDTGSGIPDDKWELVFKEFERLPQHIGGHEGVGLGLSIVQRISELLGHKITFKSRVGRGTCFGITVPRSDEKPKAREVRKKPSVGLNVSGWRILCIDDEALVLESMEKMLSGWGCKVKTAQTIDQALAAIMEENGIPDLIISDYHLGEGTGIEAVQLIHEATQTEIPVMFVTGDHSSEIQRDIKWRGFSMLRKPIKPAAFRSMLASMRQPGAD